jgi:F-type H+-transporting ATPase subunit b
VTRAALLLAFALAAQPALAAEGAEHGPSWGMLGFQVLNTAILAGVLVRFARRPIREFLAQRRQSIARGIEDAESALRAARAELDALRARLARADDEAAALERAAAEQAEAERERSLARAQAAAERIREEARRVAEQEVESARQALRAEAASLAVGVAAELVRQNLRRDDDERLVREYVARVGQSS